MPDLLVKLYDMPENDTHERMAKEGIVIKRAMAMNRCQISEFVNANFSDHSVNWGSECERAIFNDPSTCYIALRGSELIGFACYDAGTLNYFGPTGVLKSERGKGIGKALLFKCMESMKEKGYAYAIIGWAVDAVPFYEKAVNAVVIEGSTPDKSIFYHRI